jgi:simple sugar transport system permease protein
MSASGPADGAAATTGLPASAAGDRARRIAGNVTASVVPVVLALAAGGVIIAILGRDPFTFYADMFEQGLFEYSGLQESVIRMAPLLLIAAGLIVAFRAGLWNLGVDGQFLLGAVFAAGLAPSLVQSIGVAPTLILMLALATLVGSLWTLVPALLRAYYGVNEIVTTLMMSFIGIGLANLLVKGPFRTEVLGVARSDTLPVEDRLPDLFGTRIHSGILIALAGILAVHLVMTRTSLGLRFQILGASARSAVHAGLHPVRLTLVAFLVSGAFMGMSGAVEVLGVTGSFRADFNPAFGLVVIPLVFLARLNALASIVFVAIFSIIQIGGETATREAEISRDFLLALFGLILLFMAVTEYLRQRRNARLAYLTEGLAESLRASATTEAGGTAEGGEAGDGSTRSTAATAEERGR